MTDHTEDILVLPTKSQELNNRIEDALGTAFEWASYDGSHHKAWCIDQMVRALAGESYENWVKEYETPLSEDPEDMYKWDVGIPP